ncbi:MAG: Gfo/Idh/MocA family oxidoreductase [Bacteroidota bacterium]
MAGIAIIGYGYWGPNLVRNFSTVTGSKVEWVVDLRTERLEVIQKQYPNIRTTANFDDALNDPAVTAVVVATPVQHHYHLAKKALEHGKHVLIEKPMTQSSAEAEELVAIANSKGLVLMVDHTFLYTGAVRKIKELIDSGEIGDIQYFDSTRINLGLFQPDINVLWDLAPHDISILFFLLAGKPVSVSATGISHTPNSLENVAYLTVNYDATHIAHFSCSWSSPVKIRKILIGGSKKMIVFDDVEPSEKVKIYDTGYSVKNDEDKRNLLIDYRVGDIYTPKLEQREALAGMAADFISAIEKGTTPVSDWKVGLEVVKVLEAAQESIKNKGREVAIKF